MTKIETVVAVLAILFIGSMTLITNRQHYDLMYHQGYDQIAQRMEQDNDSISDIRFVTSTLRSVFPDFYQSQTDVTQRSIFDEENHSPYDLRQWLDEDQSQYLGFGWTDYVNPAWETQAVASYPWQLHENTWFTSKYLTLSKDSVPGAKRLLKPLEEEPFIFSNMEWGKPHFIEGDSLDPETDLLGVAATIHAYDTINGCILVMEVRDKDSDSVLLWQSTCESCRTLLPGTNRLVNAIRFDKKHFQPQGKRIKIYLWNQNRGTMIAERFDYYSTRFNKRLIGLYEPL